MNCGADLADVHAEQGHDSGLPTGGVQRGTHFDGRAEMAVGFDQNVEKPGAAVVVGHDLVAPGTTVKRDLEQTPGHVARNAVSDAIPIAAVSTRSSFEIGPKPTPGGQP